MQPDAKREAALFQAAAQLTGAARESFLNGACEGHPELRQRLDALLAAHEQSGGPLGGEDEPAQTVELKLPDAPDEAVGQRIDRYKILEKVGEGGCGAVYVAEQQEPVRRRVALKVVKLGMDTKQVVARFEAERQALAMMDHPNIAKVLDAGATDSGRPYFVMELVRGIKITDYCDQEKLDTPQRLDLFIQVCHAIQHAHQKGIIHRDIKPSNILVTLHDGVPVPKVIDFGIAKATEGRLTDATIYTQLHQFIGTPAYMSPEQAEMSGLDVDTRSDIYSLGVLLYELLTDKTPFDGQELASMGIDAMRKTIREQEPLRPSTRLSSLGGEELTTTAKRHGADPPKLVHLIRGDLDWIVMKCLEKDRRRRYETANGLARDIQRHLNHEPVAARPPSKLYEFQKMVRRHKVGFAATGVVIAALVVGLVCCIWALRQQHLAQRTTEARLKLSEASRIIAETGDRKAVAALLAEFDEITPESYEPDFMHSRVRRFVAVNAALQSEWREAAHHLAVLMQVDTVDTLTLKTLDLLRYTAVLARLNETNTFSKFRAETIARYTETDDPITAERVVRAFLLTPTGSELPSAFDHLQRVLEEGQEDPKLDRGWLLRPWGSLALAMLEYRRGDWTGSIEWCKRELSFPAEPARDAMTHLVLAMNEERLGRYNSAQAELDRGRELFDDAYADGLAIDRPDAIGPHGSFPDQGQKWFNWFDREHASILRREATAVIEGSRE